MDCEECNKRNCEKCNKLISKTNWSKHVLSKTLGRNPDGTVQPRRRRRPKTKNDPDQTIKPKTKHVKNNPKPRKRTNDITRKELLSQAKEYNLKGYTKWNKQQLITFF